jgi:creatinine amidohydrolase
MTRRIDRLWRTLRVTFWNLIRFCARRRDRSPCGTANRNRRAFLRTAPGLLGVGCATVPTLLRAEGGRTKANRSSSQRWEELSATDLAEALRQNSLVYVPIGTLEFHGPHLPLGMDTIHVHEFFLAAAQRTGGVVLPPTYWSPHGHEGWPGSLLIREETFKALVADVFTLLCDQGVKLIVAGTGHYPTKQEPAIRQIAADVARKNPQTRFLVVGPWCNPTDPSADHGGKKETSLMLYLRPALVYMDRLTGEQAMRGIGANAIEGTAAFGNAYLATALENCVEQVTKATQSVP